MDAHSAAGYLPPSNGTTMWHAQPPATVVAPGHSSFAPTAWLPIRTPSSSVAAVGGTFSLLAVDAPPEGNSSLQDAWQATNFSSGSSAILSSRSLASAGVAESWRGTAPDAAPATPVASAAAWAQHKPGTLHCPDSQLLPGQQQQAPHHPGSWQSVALHPYSLGKRQQQEARNQQQPQSHLQQYSQFQQQQSHAQQQMHVCQPQSQLRQQQQHQPCGQQPQSQLRQQQQHAAHVARFETGSLKRRGSASIEAAARAGGSPDAGQLRRLDARSPPPPPELLLQPPPLAGAPSSCTGSSSHPAAASALAPASATAAPAGVLSSTRSATGGSCPSLSAIDAGCSQPCKLAAPQLQPPHVVFVWDVDETLIIFHSLMNGKWAEAQAAPAAAGAGSGEAEAPVSVLGDSWRSMILKFCDQHLSFQELEQLEYTNLADVWWQALQEQQRRDAQAGAADGTHALAASGGSSRRSSCDEPASPLTAAPSPPAPLLAQPQPANGDANDEDPAPVLPHNPSLPSARLCRLFEEVEGVYSAGSGALPLLPAAASELRELCGATDAATGGWLCHARRLLVALSGTDRATCTHAVVSNGQLVATLGKLLLFGLDGQVAAREVYSASRATKLHCFKRILAKHGPAARYCVIGDSNEEEDAAEAMGWPFVRICLNLTPPAPPGAVSPTAAAAAAAGRRFSSPSGSSGGGSGNSRSWGCSGGGHGRASRRQPDALGSTEGQPLVALAAQQLLRVAL